MRPTYFFAATGFALGIAFVAACGGRHVAAKPVPDRGRATSAAGDAGFDDQGRCDYKGREDREVSETAGPGSILPNVRRVYQIIILADERRRILVCRETDTNLDGVKDVVRVFNDKGEAIQEEADGNYDGKIDTWISFTAGRISKEAIDTDGDGQPDVWKYYVVADDAKKEKDPTAPLKLSRIQRDTNHDGKPDVWEFYEGGHLERMGVDLDYDGKIDRWDHDEVARRAADDAERAAEKSATPTAADGGTGDAGTDDGGADAGAEGAASKRKAAKK
jgi:hypothetical protein